jgi:hypothetical protein
MKILVHLTTHLTVLKGLLIFALNRKVHSLCCKATIDAHPFYVYLLRGNTYNYALLGGGRAWAEEK